MKLGSAPLLLLSSLWVSAAGAQAPAAPETKPTEPVVEGSAQESPPPTGAVAAEEPAASDAPPPSDAQASEAETSPPPRASDPLAGGEPPPLQGPAGDNAPTGRAAPASPQGDEGGYELNGDPTIDNLEPVKEPSLFLVALMWDASMPLGATSDFTNSFSAQGFSIEVKYLGFGNLVLGGLVAWHTISRKGQYEETDGNTTISGTMLREFSGNPLLARVHYVFRSGKREDQKGIVVPYITGGVGGSRVMRRTDFGISVSSQESWRWALAPEVGIEYALKPVTLLAGVRLNYLFSAGDAPEEMYLNFSMGVGLE